MSANVVVSRRVERLACARRSAARRANVFFVARY
jgi:hypothetical protein